MYLLIADSDPTMTELYDSYFSNKGFRVLTVANGLECLEAIRDQIPDILIIEHQLPWGGDDGVLECLHQDYPFASPEVILITPDAFAGNSSAEKIPQANGYLRKPFLMRDLSRMIERVTESSAVGYQKKSPLLDNQ